MAQLVVAWGRAVTKMAAATVRRSDKEVVAEVVVKTTAAAARCWNGAGVAAPCSAFVGKCRVGKLSGQQQSSGATKQLSTTRMCLHCCEGVRQKRGTGIKDTGYGKDTTYGDEG